MEAATFQGGYLSGWSRVFPSRVDIGLPAGISEGAEGGDTSRAVVQWSRSLVALERPATWLWSADLRASITASPGGDNQWPWG